MADMFGSPHTIGGFEAHGLAVILGVLLLRAAKQADRRSWHALGLSVHLLLGAANLVFWSSFLRLDVLMIGVVTTALHIIFIGAQAACLWANRTTTLTEPQ
jgi:predicted membrane-bound mannosyltransferase